MVPRQDLLIWLATLRDELAQAERESAAAEVIPDIATAKATRKLSKGLPKALFT